MLLPASDLVDFSDYCTGQGWEIRPPLQFEALRLSHPRRDTLTVGALEVRGKHPIYDEAARMFQEWQDKKAATGSPAK